MRKIHRQSRRVSITAAIAGLATPITPQTVEFAAKARPVRCGG
jgi:hypothetical protein